MTTATSKDKSLDVDPKTGPPGLCQTRYFQVIVMFLGLGMAYSLRITLSIGVVAMVNASTANPDIKEYGWSSVEVGYVQSSFFWGYTATQLPSGYIAKYWSAKNLLSIGMGLCAAFSLLSPLAADFGWAVLCSCRVAMGLFQSTVMPCMHTILASWAPPSERARLVTIAYSGPYFGTMVAEAVSGVLAESSAGWPSIFYVFGALSLLWTVIFFIYGADSPSTHRWISQEERQYIERNLASVKDEKVEKKSHKTPWRAIATSPPVWALIAAHCGQNWGFWVILTQISLYMTNILHFNMSENGFKAALPHLTMLILAFPASWLSDYALRRGVPTVWLRKIANTLAQWGPAVALIGLCFTSEGDTTTPVVIFIIAVAANVGTTCGFQSNHLDLSPMNAGILMSITNFFASIVAIVVPIVVAAIVTDSSDFAQWQIVFYLTSGVYFVCNLIFLLVGTSERQWWDDPEAVEAKYGGQKRSEEKIAV